VTGFFAAALCMTAQAVPVSDAAPWRVATEEVLLPALRAAYPEVSDWTLTPLLGKGQDERLQRRPPGHVSVVRLGSRSAVRLSWKQEQRSVHSTVWFAVAGTQNVLTAVAEIRRGSALTPQLATRSRRDALAVACMPVVFEQALTGMRARVTLKEGQVICAQSIEPRPPVTRGEDVVVRAVAGAVTIMAKGVAQQDGSLGQRVRVKNPSNGNTFLAAVSAIAEVVVDE
jgi:flagella basal body P-ring formation protein FlgA